MSERQKKKIAQKEATRLKRRMIEKVKTSNVAFNLNLLVDGWLELESDPGTFSLLIEDFGCFGAQVDEIYDLEQKFEGPVYGFIFLFKWLNNQHNDRLRNQKPTSLYNNNASISDSDREQQPPEQRQWSYVEDESIISQMFFAKQMISNSCATHALISILLNCDCNELNLGPTLTRLKEHTKVMDPENKGYAIGNLPELAKAHNSHASFSSLYNRTKSYSGSGYIISGNQRTNLQQKNHEAYHFVSYVPINNRLYELDGLKNYPIDHGPIGPGGDWTEKFRSVIKHRLSSNKTGEDTSISNDIRYSLMAVVPDKRICLKANLKRMKHQYQVVQESMTRLTKRVISPLSVDVDIPNPPYSPLSNGTLTASEDGSRSGSPHRYNNNLPSDDDCKIDKYFFVKFDQQVDFNASREENSEPAHKNCIIGRESTDLSPIDLTKGIKEESASDKKDNNDSTKKDTDEENENHVERVKLHGSKVDIPSQVEETQANGKSDDGDEPKVNSVQAHSNAKYNLSTEPPFDFNILDDMQHIHVGKSTLKDLRTLSKKLTEEIEKIEALLKEEVDKRRKYKIDNSRRTHNYEPFIMTSLAMLAKHGKLADLIEKDLGLNTEESSTAQGPSRPPVYKLPKLHNATSTKVSAPNGDSTGAKPAVKGVTKPKYKYVKTGRPVGRPRKNPLVPPTPAKQ